jgi:pimeloyl-ACP methyl ester carboxylesterase
VILASILLLLAFGMLLGIVYQIRGNRKDAKLHPPPGRLVDLGTHRLHILESGPRVGKETIVMEAGLMSTVLSWSDLQHELSRSFRVVSYDRAGLGWSDLGPMPRTADRIVEELHLLLKRAGIGPPYILVGHSFGGLTMPLFAARFTEEVVGMVLVDPVAPGEWTSPPDTDLRLARIGADVCRRAACLAQIGVIRFVAAILARGVKGPGRHLVRLITRGAPGEAGSVSSPWFFALPQEEKFMAKVFWVQKKFALTIASQLENLPLSARQTAKESRFCKIPVRILSARSASERRLHGHKEMAQRFPWGEQIASGRSDHWIMQDDPDLVITTIEKVVALSRRNGITQRRSA